MHDATSIERVRSALSHLNPETREVWVRAATCIKSEFPSEGFDVWDDWGSQCAGYKAADAKAVWKSIKSAGKLTIASLFYDAKQSGWQDTGVQKKRTKAEIDADRARAAQRAAQAEAEEAVLHAERAQRAQQIWDAAKPCESHPYLVRKGVASYGLRVGPWERVDHDTGEVFVVTRQSLLIPIRDNKGQIWSLQGIDPEEGGKKRYFAGGAKQGNFFAIGKPQKHDGRVVYVLGEGYATCASVHAATGHLVLVCFDTSNLLRVAQKLRSAKPDAIILLAADNDTETPGNPGVTTARKVAEAVVGLVAVPPPGDFNDLQHAEGLDAVAGVIDAALSPPSVPVPPVPPEDVQPWEDAPDEPLLADDGAPDRAVPDADGDLDAVDTTAHFAILGYDRGEFFVFVHGQRQIVSFRPGELSEANLLMIAPLDWWEMNFPSGKEGMSRKLVLNWFFRTANARGIYNIARVRGRGAWDDDGRVVYHQGSMLYVDGLATDVTHIKSRYVYEMAKTEGSPADVGMSDAEGQMLLETAKLFRWTKPGAAALLAGWTFLAPVCGAIKWRPHIWLTGGAGSGKSTILNDFVAACIGETKVFAQGNSTEAGIRQRLKADAIPVLFDESEQNDDTEKRRMAPILALIRQASTESVAQTLKGTISGDSMNFHIRSMFCLSSIQAGLENKADQDRLTKLALMKVQDEDSGASGTWASIKEALYKIGRDKALPGRMLRRAIDMLPTLQMNITVFVDAAAKHFGTQRMGDQYGTMLAGAWCLVRKDVATSAQALEMIASFDWSEFTEAGEVDDPEKALRAILEAKIMHKGESMSVGSIIAVAGGDLVDGLSLDDKLALRIMRDHGMNISGEFLVFQNGSTALRRLVAGTQFENDVRGQLLRIKGAKRFEAKRFAPGVVSRCVGIPMSLLRDDDEPPI
jgi:putative DNA primase/helicase